MIVKHRHAVDGLKNVTNKVITDITSLTEIIKVGMCTVAEVKWAKLICVSRVYLLFSFFKVFNVLRLLTEITSG